MITTTDTDVICTVTADAFHGFHGTGMVERGYETITLRASDYEPDKALRMEPEQQEWWTDILAALAHYRVCVAESFPDDLELRARAQGYDNFAQWEAEMGDESDLEAQARMCAEFAA